MLRVIVGPNEYGARQKLIDVRESFLREYGDFALEQLNCQEVSINRVRESIQSAPFLAAKKMVILDTPSATKEFKETYENLLNEIQKSTDVVVYEPVPDKRTAYYKFLKKQQDFSEYSAVDEATSIAWLQAAAKERGGNISSPDAKYLVGRIGTNQFALANELDKLVAYNADISRESIDLLTEKSPKTTIFELLEAAFSNRSEAAMQIYNEQRQMKVEPPQIIAMLAWQLHVLALLATSKGKSDAEIATAARMSPYVIGKSRGLLRSVGASRLKQLISDLAELDYKAKTSAIDTDRGLQIYIAAIS